MGVSQRSANSGGEWRICPIQYPIHPKPAFVMNIKSRLNQIALLRKIQLFDKELRNKDVVQQGCATCCEAIALCVCAQVSLVLDSAIARNIPLCGHCPSYDALENFETRTTINHNMSVSASAFSLSRVKLLQAFHW
jgi:hypothetical protein